MKRASVLCELLHDIVGLYNAFGGYLIIAFTDPQAPRFAKLTNKDDFDKLSDRYLRTYLPIAPFKTKATLDGKQTCSLFALKRGPPALPFAISATRRTSRTAILFLSRMKSRCATAPAR
jgi:hypothetical protein